MQGTGLSEAQFTSYQASVHGRAVAAGNTQAAVCTDCHGVHDILNAGNPKSPIFKFNVPQTCGKCHQNIDTRVHGQHSRPGGEKGQLAGAGVHGLSRHSFHHGAYESKL